MVRELYSHRDLLLPQINRYLTCFFYFQIIHPFIPLFFLVKVFCRYAGVLIWVFAQNIRLKDMLTNWWEISVGIQMWFFRCFRRVFIFYFFVFFSYNLGSSCLRYRPLSCLWGGNWTVFIHPTFSSSSFTLTPVYISQNVFEFLVTSKEVSIAAALVGGSEYWPFW